ncbi:hypothetical protein [Vibrio sp. 1CM23M]|uniref:hypothetical protein n=1 Tax=Vibrio sp. 1CM23M TaxID=2929164 RepID=UPI0020BFF741|nr:hypothetical protein [Vibrio sp. 1CM23M]MCK8073978.1 hypothetical protein [Vibrio sp. 1CM23M]
MEVIIFDLDNTLVDTRACKPYLQTSHGRALIVDKLREGEIETVLYDEKIVDYVNNLSDMYGDTHVVFITDSPNSPECRYCETILDIHGFQFDDKHILSNAGKPCCDLEEFLDGLARYHDQDFSDVRLLVIGDSAKDIHFGHYIESPSVFCTWGTEFEEKWITDNAIPTAIVNNLDELDEIITDFINDTLEYEAYDFQQHFHTVSLDDIDVHTIPDENIGHSRDFIPRYRDCSTQAYKNTWFDVYYGLKPAKNLTYRLLNRNCGVPYCTSAGKVNDGSNVALKRLSGIYIKQFYEWAEEKGLEGKVALVPIPSSVPEECNHSRPMAKVVYWWEEWANAKNNQPYEIKAHQVIERWEPKKPSHKSHEARRAEAHIETLGVYKEEDAKFPKDITAVVLLDDVYTSGAQMNAVASVLKGLDMIPENVPIYGYAFARTKSTNPFANIQAIIDQINAAENEQ